MAPSAESSEGTKRVLVVCTANICRSPMAAAWLEHLVDEKGLRGSITVASAGAWAEEGRAATSSAIRLLSAEGLDIREHRSRRASPELVSEADVVLAMEEAQRGQLFMVQPSAAARLLVLSELSGGHRDVADPYGGSDADYRRCFEDIQSLLVSGWQSLCGLLGVDADRPRSTASGAPRDPG